MHQTSLVGIGRATAKVQRPLVTAGSYMHLTLKSVTGNGDPMFVGVGSIPVLVYDAKKAAKWYEEKLGFEVNVQGHWVTVKPKGSQVTIHLCEKCDDWEGDRPGGNTGIFLTSDDKQRTYQELKAGGVQLKVELTEAPWAPGKYAILKDLDGNEFWM